MNGNVEDDKVLEKRQQQQQQRRKRESSRNGGSSTSSHSDRCFPTSWICSASTTTGTTTNSGNGNIAMPPTGATEVAVILLVLVVALYLFGFYEAAMALPDVPGQRDIFHHMGRNLNLPNPKEWDYVAAVIQHDQEQRQFVDGDQGEENDSEQARILSQQKQQQEDVAGAAGAGMQGAAAVAPKEAVRIPKATWPVSIRDEDRSTYETIIHPGDGVTEMRVPRFWSRPVHNSEFFTREKAMKVGSCIQPDAQGNYNRGDACPIHQRTIYVGIASYRDFECRSTAESIFLRAKHPERIRIGVVDQIVDGEDAICNAPIVPCDEDPEQGLCKYASQIDVYQMDAPLSIGPVFARHIGYRLYRGEYYATQSDAHVTYTQDWDEDIIQQLESTQNDMAVLTTYLTDIQGSIDENGNSLRDTRPIMCNTVYEGGAQGMHLRHASQPERRPGIHGTPQLQPWWAAGYSFSRGHFVVNVPYDWLQPMIFQGEEMSIGIRGFTIGYDYYAPERSVCFHHYAVGKNAKLRSKVHHFWENDNKYAGTGRKAMQRLLGIVHMNPEIDPSSWDHAEEDIYGIGGVRTPEKFYETFGIDVVGKTVQRHLCFFVDLEGRMHKEFTQLLRPDGMGIDYSQIHYKFVDPRPNERR